MLFLFYACFSCEVEKKTLPKVNKAVGIDMGLESFAVTADDIGSTTFIKNPRCYKSAQSKLRILQRSVCRKKKGSNSRKKAVKQLAKQHEKIASQRKDFLHKEATKIIKKYDVACIEDLNIKGLASGMLAKSVNDASWGIFFNMLMYKAENADRQLIKVNPNGTSKRCNKCQTVVKKELSDRWHSCPVCYESCHRDVNSALEVLRLGTNQCKLTWNISSCVLQEAV